MVDNAAADGVQGLVTAVANTGLIDQHVEVQLPAGASTLAWAGAFVLTLFVLLISLVARAIVLRNKMVHD